MAISFEIPWDEENGFWVATRRGYRVRWRMVDARHFDFSIDGQGQRVWLAVPPPRGGELEEMERLVLSAVDQLPARR